MSMAAKLGHLSLVDQLNKKGLNVDVVDSQGATPLHHAAAYDHFGVVKYLVKEGKAKVDVMDK